MPVDDTPVVRLHICRRKGISLIKKRTKEILEKLDERYGTEYVCYLEHRNAQELLIATILSAQCTDARVNIVTEKLFKQYPTLQESEYRRRLLELFRQQGLDINAEQLDMLLLLRQKTDQMLLERAAEKPESAT